jgi:tRNA threonylcarbamoyladenosine biosynthesis protein TsaE
MAESPPLTKIVHSVPLDNLAATEALAVDIARRARRRDVIALSGGLGMGKTAFARAFIRARPGGDEVAEVPSPTFTLVQVYDLPDAPVWHFDLYRLTRAEDAWELGIEEAFAEAISLIEWPDRLGDLLPGERLDIDLVPAESPDARRATLTGHGSWAARLDDLDG